MSPLIRQLQTSRIPYPERIHLEREIAYDLAHTPSQKTHLLTIADLSSLEEIHCTWTARTLERFGFDKKSVELFMAFIPLTLVLIFLGKERVMIDFIREGGAGMYALIALGGFLLAGELKTAFRLIIVKDHAKENLRLDTSTVMLGCLALIFLGVGWTVLGIYISANAALAANASHEVLMTGVKESLAPTVLSMLLSAIVILAHYGIRRVMNSWHAPLA